jgi:hypothetical protein
MPFMFCPFSPLCGVVNQSKILTFFVCVGNKEEDAIEFDHLFSSLLRQIYDLI